MNGCPCSVGREPCPRFEIPEIQHERKRDYERGETDNLSPKLRPVSLQAQLNLMISRRQPKTQQSVRFRRAERQAVRFTSQLRGPVGIIKLRHDERYTGRGLDVQVDLPRFASIDLRATGSFDDDWIRLMFRGTAGPFQK